MSTSNLTSLFVERVEPPDKGQRVHFDGRVSGFGLRVSMGGKKTWVLLYRHQGRLRWLSLGTFPTLGLADARDMAKSQLAEVQKGIDVACVKQGAREADTFAQLAGRYLAEHARIKKKPKSVHEDEKMLDRELLPRWGARKASDISRRDVIELVDGIAARGAWIQANRVLALVSKIFNFGLAKLIVEANPGHRLPKPGMERQRDRVLSEGEIRVLWKTLEGEAPRTSVIFKLALLTAQRKGEVCGMGWSEVDLDTGWWTIPAERAKNSMAHRVPLGAQALGILREIRAATPESEAFVFRGGRVGRPIENLQKPMKRLKAISGVDFRFHDLRRTAASLMVGSGVQRLVVSKILNHAEQGVTRVYDRHSYDNEKRAALIKWDARVREMVTGEPAGKLIALSA